MSADEAIKTTREALGRGDLLAAFDTLQQVAGEDDPQLDYLRVLTLARLGDTTRALKLYDSYRLDQHNEVDALALKARLLKDQAFMGGSEGRRDALMRACRLYASLYRRARDTYPAVNAATLAAIAGRERLAKMFAQAAIDALPDTKRDYYAWATAAEALLILGDIPAAKAAVRSALRAPDADIGKRSTTVLQLRRLASVAGPTAPVHALLAMVQPPAVAHFCGHIFMPDAALEADLKARTRDALIAERVGFAYGALAAGSDIVIAEEVLALGAELHVVLPVLEKDFIAQSVAPAGEAWIARYHACRERAASVTFSSSMAHVGGQGQFAYGSSVAMGMACLRARQLQGEAVQIAIVEASASSGSLTRSDVRAWQARGNRALVVGATGLVRPMKPATAPGSAAGVERGTFGLMFTDFPGFARLDEQVLPVFQEVVMARAGEVLDAHADKILYSNTWGDALYVVFRDAVSTAQTALEVCDALSAVDSSALGLRGGGAMRIALHFGPTYFGVDKVTRRVNYYGSEVSRAARIEPVTPPGSVYVTEPFAAILEMESGHDFACDYVGQVELPKGYGVYPLYHLKRRAG